MKLTKCPNCGAKQGFTKILFLTNFGSRVCDNCQVRYETVTSKVVPLTLIVIAPLALVGIFSDLQYYFGLSFAWASIGLALLLYYMPLRVLNTDADK